MTRVTLAERSMGGDGPIRTGFVVSTIDFPPIEIVSQEYLIKWKRSVMSRWGHRGLATSMVSVRSTAARSRRVQGRRQPAEQASSGLIYKRLVRLTMIAWCGRLSLRSASDSKR
ncbi:hypothetical protein SPRG_21703, partial [Saprolegnia parasitica CBS 223.65]